MHGAHHPALSTLPLSTLRYSNQIGCWNFPNYFFCHFVWKPQRHNRWWHSDMELFFKFLFLKLQLKQAQSSDQIHEEGWEVQDGSTRVRRVVNSGGTLLVVEGGTSGRRRGNVTLMWFVSFFIGQSFPMLTGFWFSYIYSSVFESFILF